MNKAYISGPLTNTPKINTLKKFYEKLGDECLRQGWNAYIPHQHSDPLMHPNIDPETVYRLDRQNVICSDLVIAYVGIPSIGVGQEIEIAATARIPVILLFERDRSVSRMVRGNPIVVAEITRRHRDEMIHDLGKILCESQIYWKNSNRSWRLSNN